MTRESINSGANSNRRGNKKKRKSASRQHLDHVPPADDDDVLYAIRDIIAEKFVTGKLYYRIDWADNPSTGETYDPTWEPAENATEAAIASWEEQKRRTRESPEGEDSKPVLPPNWRAKRRRTTSSAARDERPSKRPKGILDEGVGHASDATNEEELMFVDSVPANNGKLVLEIPSRLDFDTSEYLAISSSQGAQSDAQSTQAQAKTGVSQSTIPDSQALTDRDAILEVLHPESSSQGLFSTPQENRLGLGGVAEEEVPSAVDSGPQQGDHAVDPVLSHTVPTNQLAIQTDDPSSHSGPSIPSRQLDLEQQDSERSPELAEIHNYTPGFLTQPEFDLPLVESETSSPRTSEPGLSSDASTRDHHETDRAGNLSAVVSATESLHRALSPLRYSQAAQVVPPLDSDSDHIQTHLQGSVDESDIVPETVQKQAAGKETLLGSNRTPSELDRLAQPSTSDKSASSAKAPRGRASRLSLSHPSTKTSTKSSPIRPVTPSDSGMSGSPVDTTPRSAVDQFRQLRTSIFGSSAPNKTTPSPAAEATQSQMVAQERSLISPSRDEPISTVEQIKGGGGLGLPRDLSTTRDSVSPADLVVQGPLDLNYEQVPSTIAPSDLITPTDYAAAIDHASLPFGDENLLGESPEVIERRQSSQDEPEDEKITSQTEFVVTLPMAANCRERYLRVISENKATMIEFGEVFASSLSRNPEESLVAKMDAIFQQLLDLCDLPAWAGDVPGMSQDHMMRHATNTNSKFLFIFEYLNELRDMNSRILILSRPGPTFECLEAVVSASQFNYTVLGREEQIDEDTEGLAVILASADQDLSGISGDVDVVITFDNVARATELPPSLTYEDTTPIVLRLVVTYSLEHIDLQLGHELEGLERKNALNLATAESKDLLRAPEGGYPEPHEAAEIFAGFLRSPEGGLIWEPQALPEDIFDVWLSSQVQHETPGGVVVGSTDSSAPMTRKRPYDDTEEGVSKRVRTLDLRQATRISTAVPMSDLLKRTLASHRTADQPSTQQVEVPVAQLEFMAAKIAELEDRLVGQERIEGKLGDHVKSMEGQLRAHERTTQTIQRKYMEALRDRGTFDKKCQQAEREAKLAKDSLDASKSEVGVLKERIKDLESKLAESKSALLDPANPDLARLAQTEKELEEARARVQSLEKKVKGAQNDLEYSRTAYQNASNSFGELNRENQDLKERVADLEKRASENLIKVHEINARSQQEADFRQMEEYRATIRDRERELDRVRDELRHLKNGRRETRQASVPRSPRTGVMSPRPGRNNGGNNGGGGGGGGTGSRGTSPAPVHDSLGLSAAVPGMTYFSQPPGNRWGHLRD